MRVMCLAYERGLLDDFYTHRETPSAFAFGWSVRVEDYRVSAPLDGALYIDQTTGRY